MDIDIKNILQKIEDNGYEAYVIGGYVRDYLLGIRSYDIDICTNALPKDIARIFELKIDSTEYGSITIKNNQYNFDITTYREESNYQNRRPQTIKYINNLITDIKRRDFTINTLCMNKDGNIFDYLNAKDDLNNKIIKTINPPEVSFKDDPLRMLRALRFAIILDFDISTDIEKFILNNKELISSLSYTRKKEEIDKILVSKNAIKGLNLLRKYDLLSTLEIDYDKIIEVPDILGMWAQLSFSSKYPFTKDNLRIISSIKNIVSLNEITNYSLFKEGLYICTVAGAILKIDNHQINEQYKNLPIKSVNDLCIKPKDIINILNIKPSKEIKIIFEDILNKVLNKEIENNYQKIKEYIISNWK